MLLGGSALDVIAFEEQKLGNTADFAHLAPLARAALAKIGSSDVVWVARKRSAAARYGDVRPVDIGKHARVIAEDGDGGLLVLCSS